jgi:hypothetical protein
MWKNSPAQIYIRPLLARDGRRTWSLGGYLRKRGVILGGIDVESDVRVVDGNIA